MKISQYSLGSGELLMGFGGPTWAFVDQMESMGFDESFGFVNCNFVRFSGKTLPTIYLQESKVLSWSWQGF